MTLLRRLARFAWSHTMVTASFVVLAVVVLSALFVHQLAPFDP